MRPVADYGQELRFGVFITPAAAQAGDVVELAKLADLTGLDLVSFQDHPYQPSFLDTWTLLSVVAAATSTVRLAPNVANLPLRPPAVLARSVASLDILSGGRVELGLGAGAFWDGIAALGGERLKPGRSVDALAEAIEVIRSLWDGQDERVSYEGEHYHLDGARPGPAPAHAVEIWLGAYKPRMLALTGEKADGWLPSLGYADLDELPDMNAAIDEAAQDAGRDPAEVRRLFNVNGRFGGDGGFLQGGPSDWAEQLAELTLSTGMSSYILAADSDEDIHRFAEDVAPAVRELVEAARSSPEAERRQPRPRRRPPPCRAPRWRSPRPRTTARVSATNGRGTRTGGPAAPRPTASAATALTSRPPASTWWTSTTRFGPRWPASAT